MQVGQVCIWKGKKGDDLNTAKVKIVAVENLEHGDYTIEVLEKRDSDYHAGFRINVCADSGLIPLNTRFKKAVDIVDPGACNPSGVSIALHEAIVECKEEGLNPKECPACGLIAHQLYNILGCLRYEYGESGNEYGADLKICREWSATIELLNERVS